MNIKELREAISNLPDDMVVLVSGGYDHGYNCPRHAEKTTVGKCSGPRRFGSPYVEWFGPEHASPGETVLDALVIEIR